METKITNKEKSQKEIEITLLPEEVRDFFEKTAKKISTERQFKGFRPGKAPVNIVQEEIGKEIFWKEACYEALESTYYKIVQEGKFTIVSNPEVKIIKMAMDNPFCFKVIVSVLPEFDVPDYKTIANKVVKKEKKEIIVSKKETEETLNQIRKSRAKLKRVTRAARQGDEVNINYEGSIEGAKQEALKQENFKIILGETKFIDGFVENIEGMKEGETKEFSLKIPLTGEDKKIVEKEVSFSIKVVSVFERELPEIDDNFAQSLGEFSNITELEKKLEENIKLEKERKQNEVLRLKIIEEIAKKTQVEIPEIMIERESDNMIEDFKHRLEHSGVSFDSYLSANNKKEDDFKNELKEEAEKRIKTSLIIKKIAEKENIKATEEEIKKEEENYYKYFDPSELQSKKKDERVTLYLKDLIENEKVFQLLENFESK